MLQLPLSPDTTLIMAGVLEMYDRERLEACRERILREKSLALSTAGDSVDRILNPSDRKDWQKIRYYPRVRLSRQTLNGLNRNLRNYLEDISICKG